MTRIITAKPFLFFALGFERKTMSFYFTFMILTRLARSASCWFISMKRWSLWDSGIVAYSSPFTLTAGFLDLSGTGDFSIPLHLSCRLNDLVSWIVLLHYLWLCWWGDYKPRPLHHLHGLSIRAWSFRYAHTHDISSWWIITSPIVKIWQNFFYHGVTFSRTCILKSCILPTNLCPPITFGADDYSTTQLQPYIVHPLVIPNNLYFGFAVLNSFEEWWAQPVGLHLKCAMISEDHPLLHFGRCLNHHPWSVYFWWKDKMSFNQRSKLSSNKTGWWVKLAWFVVYSIKRFMGCLGSMGRCPDRRLPRLQQLSSLAFSGLTAVQRNWL